MTITIHAQGAERKRLVQIISDWLGVPAKYCGAPTFNYEVDYFTIDRNGSLSFDDRADRRCLGIVHLNKLHTGADRIFFSDTLDRLFTRKSHAAHLRF